MKIQTDLESRSYVEKGEIFKYEGHYLRVVETRKYACASCFFNSRNCDGISCNSLESYCFMFEELSEIEALILTGDKNDTF